MASGRISAPSAGETTTSTPSGSRSVAALAYCGCARWPAARREAPPATPRPRADCQATPSPAHPALPGTAGGSRRERPPAGLRTGDPKEAGRVTGPRMSRRSRQRSPAAEMPPQGARTAPTTPSRTWTPHPQRQAVGRPEVPRRPSSRTTRTDRAPPPRAKASGSPRGQPGRRRPRERHYAGDTRGPRTAPSWSGRTRSSGTTPPRTPSMSARATARTRRAGRWWDLA